MWQETSIAYGTVKGKIKFKKYFWEEYDSMLMAEWQLVYELQHKAVLLKGKKNPESNKAFEARVVMLETKADNSSNESLFADEKPKANNRNNPALEWKGSSTR